MPWYQPDKYKPEYKELIRGHVKRRREASLLHVFWEWRVLELLCDEIDRLEGRVAELSDLNTAAIDFAELDIGSILYKVEPYFSSMQPEYDIVEYFVIRKEMDGSWCRGVWVTKNSEWEDGECGRSTKEMFQLNTNNDLDDYYASASDAKIGVANWVQSKLAESRDMIAETKETERQLETKMTHLRALAKELGNVV